MQWQLAYWGGQLKRCRRGDTNTHRECMSDDWRTYGVVCSCSIDRHFNRTVARPPSTAGARPGSGGAASPASSAWPEKTSHGIVRRDAEANSSLSLTVATMSIGARRSPAQPSAFVHWTPLMFASLQWRPPARRGLGKGEGRKEKAQAKWVASVLRYKSDDIIDRAPADDYAGRTTQPSFVNDRRHHCVALQAFAPLALLLRICIKTTCIAQIPLGSTRLDTSSSTGATCNLVMITVIHLLFNKLFTD